MPNSRGFTSPTAIPQAAPGVAALAGEVTQPVDPDQPSIPEEPVVAPPSEPVGPVVPDVPAVPIDPTPDREVPEPSGPEVGPEPDPPAHGVRARVLVQSRRAGPADTD